MSRSKVRGDVDTGVFLAVFVALLVLAGFSGVALGVFTGSL